MPDNQAVPAQFHIRKDLILHCDPDEHSESRVVLEDTANHKFFKLGSVEANFFKILQSEPSVQKAMSNQPAEKALDEQQVIRFCRWLETSGLLEDSTASNSKPSKNFWAQLFFFRWSVVNPDSSLERLVKSSGFLFSWQASCFALVVASVGACIAASQWTDFVASYTNLLSPWRGVWLLVTWFALKIVHEVSHGGVCRRYGGNVPDAGIALILFMPIAYVDVSSSWKFASRWQRLHVTLAGVIAELFVAGSAMFLWLSCDSLVMKNAAADVVLAASFTTLLFNLNPLLKFDGYFALSDITGIDNLYQYGQSYARYFGRRYILGLQTDQPNLPTRLTRSIKIYGVVAAVWRVVTVSGLLMGAAMMFAGAGIALAMVGCIFFILKPLWQLAKELRVLHQKGELSLTILGMRVSILSACTAGLLFLVPGELRRTCPGIIEYDPPATLLAPTNGFVEQVFVLDGQFVRAGQPILQLHNDEIELDALRKQTQLEQAKFNFRSAQWQSDSSKLEEARSSVHALEQQYSELAKRVDQMLVCAPHDGKVVSRSLRVLPGQYLHQGDEIGAIGDERSKRLKISLSEWEATRFDQWRDLAIHICVPGKWGWKSQISRVETRASEIPPDASLTAANGGSLPVQAKDGYDDPVLTSPRVNAYISLGRSRSEQLRSGQRCVVRIACSQMSLGAKLWRSLQDVQLIKD